MRLRQRVTKGAGSRTKGLLIAYKLLDMAQARWRQLDGAHLLPVVRAGITFVDGVQQTTRGPGGTITRPERLSESRDIVQKAWIGPSEPPPGE